MRAAILAALLPAATLAVPAPSFLSSAKSLLSQVNRLSDYGSVVFDKLEGIVEHVLFDEVIESKFIVQDGLKCELSKRDVVFF